MGGFHRVPWGKLATALSRPHHDPVTGHPLQALPLFSRLLFRAPHWIGDAVMGTPALRAVMETRPDLRVVVATRLPALQVFQNHPGIEDRWEMPPAGSDGAFVRRVHEGRFAATLLLSPSFRSAWQVARARVPERWGYRSDTRGWLLTEAPEARRGPPPRHQADDYLHLVKALGGRTPSHPWPEVHPSSSDHLAASAVLRALPRHVPTVALQPGAAFGPTKRWPEDRFIAVGREVIQRGGAVAVLGGPEEEKLCQSVARAVDPAQSGVCLPFAGPLSLPLLALASLAPRMAALVTNDTGPMHLWAAGGGRVLAVFGMSLPELHGPRGPHAPVFFHLGDLPCRGCYRKRCPTLTECLTGISAGEVSLSLLPLLDSPPSLSPRPAREVRP